MALAAVKFYAYVQNQSNGVINFSSDVFKLLLTANQPVTATNALYGDITGEVATGGGYTLGGVAATTTSAGQTGGVEKLILSVTSPTWTGTGSGFGPFRYIVLYDSTPATKPLLLWWDYGASVTVTSGQSFAILADAVNGVIQIA